MNKTRKANDVFALKLNNFRTFRIVLHFFNSKDIDRCNLVQNSVFSSRFFKWHKEVCNANNNVGAFSFA